MKYADKWTRRLQGDFQFINKKLVKASYMLDEETRKELIEALTVIGNAVSEITVKVGEGEGV